MKKQIGSLLAVIAILTGFCSCEKMNEGSGSSYLEGHYVCKRAEVTLELKDKTKHTETIVFDGESAMVYDESGKEIETLAIARKADESFGQTLGVSFYQIALKQYLDNYLTFDYEYVFSKDGGFLVRVRPEEDMVDADGYVLKDGFLYWREVGLEYPVYRIVSNKGNTLVLECSDFTLEIINLKLDLADNPTIIKKSVATFIKM